MEKKANQFSNRSEKKDGMKGTVISLALCLKIGFFRCIGHLVNLESGTNFEFRMGIKKNGCECKLVEAVLLHFQKNVPKCNEPSRMHATICFSSRFFSNYFQSYAIT